MHLRVFRTAPKNTCELLGLVIAIRGGPRVHPCAEDLRRIIGAEFPKDRKGSRHITRNECFIVIRDDCVNAFRYEAWKVDGKYCTSQLLINEGLQVLEVS